MIRATTILGLRYKNKVAMGGDGQVTLDKMIVKSGAQKVRKLYDGKVLAGFAGSASDAMNLLDKFEKKLEEFHGNLKRASIELAKEWRTDKYLRTLEAFLGVMDDRDSFVISGRGDIIEPDDGIIALGSGSGYALAASRAYLSSKPKGMDASDIIKLSLEITSNICIYTNSQITIIELE